VVETVLRDSGQQISAFFERRSAMKRRAKMMVAVALIFLSGCTGTKMMVRPELAGEEK
jgi:hypothetical protein